jgi:5-formyltetrahydrofolate cyclo-ligase
MVSVPVVKGEEIFFSEIFSLSELEKSSFGLLEPKNQKIVEAKKLDLIIVPGASFDKNGNRIGYGKGYYDRFLKTISKHASTIGLCFEDNIEENIPTEAHDVKVDVVLTEKNTFK